MCSLFRCLFYSLRVRFAYSTQQINGNQIKSLYSIALFLFRRAGKSTLIQALFRLLEAEEGNIVIDGVDTVRVGLHKLRTSMSVIPQTPTLFSGCTVRENLDPFDQYGVSEIRSALSDASMLSVIEEQAEGLDSIVAEGGCNFSVGQRQLLCLARAILRKSPILVLDEGEYLGTEICLFRRFSFLIHYVNYSFCAHAAYDELHLLGIPRHKQRRRTLTPGRMRSFNRL